MLKACNTPSHACRQLICKEVGSDPLRVVGSVLKTCVHPEGAAAPAAFDLFGRQKGLELTPRKLSQAASAAAAKAATTPTPAAAAATPKAAEATSTPGSAACSSRGSSKGYTESPAPFLLNPISPDELVEPAI